MTELLQDYYLKEAGLAPPWKLEMIAREVDYFDLQDYKERAEEDEELPGELRLEEIQQQQVMVKLPKGYILYMFRNLETRAAVYHILPVGTN